MIIIGCDYSTKKIDFGWKYRGRWSTIPIKVVDELDLFLEDLAASFPYAPEGHGHLYLERPWARFNVHTGMQMQRIATIVDVVATQQGYETHWVAIQAWRSKVFGKGKYTTKDAKLLALAKAEQECGIVTLDDNVADALCLALYGASAHED